MITEFPALYRREESRAFVAGIRANPDDDTARLAFADWLDDNADGDAAHRDHYAARAEFLRAGCQNPGKSLTRLNRAESRWLDENWERLFPTLMQVHGYHNHAPVLPPLLWRKGRVLRFNVCYYLRRLGGNSYPRHASVDLRDYAGYFTAHLRRGFIDRIDWHGNLPYWTRLMPAIAKDDPFVCCRFPKLFEPVLQPGGEWHLRLNQNDVGADIFQRLTLPVRAFEMPHGIYLSRQFGIYIGRHRIETLLMAKQDLNRASREWAEAAPITVSMTDAEFFGEGRHSLADAMSV